MEIKRKARLRKILRKGEQLSTNRRLLEEKEETLRGNPRHKQKRSSSHSQHDQRAEIVIIRRTS